ncbi:hypothetical protein D3C75_432960 [compost metagenome]
MGSIQAAKSNIVADGAFEQMGLLGDIGEQRLDLRLIHQGKIPSMDKDLSRFRPMEPVCQVEQRSFACSAGADQRNGVSSGYGKADIMQHLSWRVRVRKGNVVVLHASCGQPC